MLAETGLMLAPHGDTSTYSSDSDDAGSDSEDYKQLESFINPVTGRAEPDVVKSPFEGMSDEQKEYETMRLVNDLDKLTRLGGIRPARIGADGRPHQIEHVLELQQNENKADEAANRNN